MFVGRIVCRNLRSLPCTQTQKFKGSQLEVLNYPQFHLCAFSSKVNTNRNIPTTERDPETGEVKKKKSAIIPKVTVLHGDELTVTTLEEAQKLAKRRDLKLVKVSEFDSKTQRAVYRLMTGTEYLQEDLKQREKKKTHKHKGSIKGEKVLSVSQNISEHDLQIDVNKIVKWLAKRYEVIMVINGNAENFTKAEKVFSFLENHLSLHGQIVQKRRKGSDIRFQVVPPKEPKNSSDNENKQKGPDKPVL